MIECESKSESSGSGIENDHTIHTACSSTHNNNNMIKIPWKWDNVSKIKEIFKPRHDWCSSEVRKSVDSLSYNVLLDTRHFEPSDLNISLTERSVSIHGVHEEKDGGRREFRRKFIFPSDGAMVYTECILNILNGVLNVRIPTKSTIKFKESKPNENLNDISIVHPVTPITGAVPGKTESETNKTQVPSLKENKLFSVALDVRFYDASEIQVTTSEHQLKVEATHKEKDPKRSTSYTSRQFSRTYSLPNEVNPVELKGCVTRDGVLRIMGPKNTKSEGESGCTESKSKIHLITHSHPRRRSWVTDALLLQFGRVHLLH